MPAKNKDLHGSAPDKSPVALLLIDVINDMEFDDGDKLLANALPAARKIAVLKRKARKAGIPVIYVNDNFGKWRSDFNKLVEHCLKSGVRGEPVVKLLKPNKNDYFVLKPKHSGFFDTSLEILLKYLEVKTLIMAGFAGNICVLFTANDAYMYDFKLFVPSDCCASNEVLDNDYALKQIEGLLKADIRPSDEIDLTKF
ncbi:MAG: isochorismatase family cysteine hydrolase [Bacteroidota bacterium]